MAMRNSSSSISPLHTQVWAVGEGGDGVQHKLGVKREDDSHSYPSSHLPGYLP